MSIDDNRRSLPFLFISALVLFAAIILCFRGNNINMGDNMIPELSKANVRMKNPARVQAMIQGFIEGGRDKLQVIADFDRTLSRFKYEGKIMPTCHNVLNSSDLMPENFKKRAVELYHKYYPIEMDKSLTPEEKLPHMVEWWTAAHDMMVGAKITRPNLDAMISKSNVKLREGCGDFFLSLRDSHVPLLIFSAGVGDIIEGVLRLHSQLYDNMKIVSNFMHFDEQGLCTGFKGEIIHIYNKNEGAIHDSDYFKVLHARKNVLLLGDSVGDLTMAKGVDDGTILKIGFLNDRVEDLLETYMDLYDIVLVDDESMDVGNAIIKAIL